MRRGVISVSVAGLLCMASCSVDSKQQYQLPSSVAAALASAPRLELLSLHPVSAKAELEDAFHGWKVLGRTVLDAAALRREVVASITKGVADTDGRRALCFEPRHGIRAHSGDTAVDLVICFECMQVEAYVNDKLVEGVPTTSSAEATLDRILRAANVPLAPKG